MAKLEQVSRNGKYGYKSSDGSIVIEPQYDDCVGTFGRDSYNNTEYAIVAIDGKCGMINESGETVIPLEYQEVKHLFDDLFVVRNEAQDKSWCVGVIKPNGDIVIPFDYKYIEAFGNYIVCYKEACSNRVYNHTLIDTHGAVYEYSWKKDSVVYYCDGRLLFEGSAVESKYGLLVVDNNKQYGVINSDGNIIIDVKYNDIIIVSPDRFIVRINDCDSWSMGVLDAKADKVIDFTYKYITSREGVFFDCFKECDSSLGERWPYGEKYEYRNKSQEYWLNSLGRVVYKGKAEVLSKNYLVGDRSGKKAVFDFDGGMVVNFIYDRVRLLDNYLIVGKDSKVGVLTNSGKNVIDVIYENIEFVHIDDSVCPKYGDMGQKDSIVYGSYNKNNIFDTSSLDRLNRQMIRFVKRKELVDFDFECVADIVCPQDRYSFNDILILRSSTYAELFSLEEGIICNSRYSTIQQLTDLSYVVSIDGKYGVYRRDIHKLIIPCEYGRIIFEGDHVVLLNKDGLWGAKTLVLPEHPLYPNTRADVPVKYKEISILDSLQSLYGVKYVRTNYKGKEIEEYTILDEQGEVFEKMGEFSELSSMPILYDKNHILTSHNEKFGFVSVKGFVSVPFIYDEIKERDDSLFDVRIDNRWGVIDVSGKIIVSIKYSHPLGGVFDNAIVEDSCSGRFGVLASDGREKVPTVYEHLRFGNNAIYYGFGGYQLHNSFHSDFGNFFSGDIVGASWGVITKDGVPIIDPVYDCFKEVDGFIMAGRDGEFLGEGNNYYTYESEYGGVYDLYDYEGNLILGGFDKFFKEEEHNLFYFQYGGKWKQECDDCDRDYYHYIECNTRWLVTDYNLTSIIPDTDGKSFTFRRGAQCEITRKIEDGKVTRYWSFPLEQLSVIKPILYKGLFLIGDENKQMLINYKDKRCSKAYSKLEIINSNLFFIYDNSDGDGVGISSFERELIQCGNQFVILTVPVSNHVFAVKENNRDYYKVLYVDITEPKECITAIDNIAFGDLVALLKYGKLQILSNDDIKDKISLRDKSVFDDTFTNSIEVEEIEDAFDGNSQYWFSVRFTIDLGDYYDDGDYFNAGDSDDGWDYKRETWDALTDGMYGDMPDGFDGDYGFLGY